MIKRDDGNAPASNVAADVPTHTGLMNTKSHKGKQGHALFNTCFKTFLRELSVRFPDVKEFKVMIGLYKVIKTLNAKIVHSMWRVATDPFLADMMRHDATFFVDPNMPVPEGFEAFAYMLPTFRKCWLALDHDEQQNVWAHIDLLINLSLSLVMETACIKQHMMKAMQTM